MFSKKESIKQKNIIQENAVQLLYKHRRIMLSWATGCGKTLAALKMVKQCLKELPHIKGHIICKETNHISNWEIDIKEHGMEFINDISTKFLYASLHKYPGIVDFVILDECHAITDERFKQLKKIIGPETIVIFLSATVDYIHSGYLRALAGPYHEYHIDIITAIEKGILPPPKVYVHKYSFNKEQQKEYDMISEEIAKLGDKYDITREKWVKNQWVNAGSRRKRMMAEFKTDLAKQLLKKEFDDCRFICFTGSIKQCNALGRHNYIHSGRSKETNLKKRDSFNAERINNLFVVNMFRESMNLFNIHKGLIIQLDSGKRSFIQMLGRVFRSALPEMHIIVWKDSKDEKYLKNVLKGFDTQYLTIIEH